MSESLGTPVEDRHEEHWTEELEELPTRPRRKLLTPLTGALLALLIAACGFIGGVLVEKGQGSSSPSAGGLAALRGGAAPRDFQNALAGKGGKVTAGQVSSVEGRTIYVSTGQGGTVRVKVPVGESVSRTVTTSVHAIHPGDTVIVQGPRGKGGVIKATSVRATQASSSGSGGAVLNQLFGGGGPSGGQSGASALRGLFGKGG